MTTPETIQLVASTYPPRSVTVLKSSRAEIVRSFPVKLKSGQNKVIISKLSSSIDHQSVRVSGLNSNAQSTAKTYLSDVTFSPTRGSSDSSNTFVDGFEDEKKILLNEKNALELQADILVSYARTLTGEHVSPSDFQSFLKSFVSERQGNIQAIARIEDSIKEIDEKIQEEMQKASLLKGSANAELTVIIFADKDTQLDLKVTYIVSNTEWTPTYELYAVTGDDGKPSRTISLHYRARVTQTTGEDWNDATLILSTSDTDSIANSIPKSESIKVSVAPKFKRYPVRDGGVRIFGSPAQQATFGGTAPLGQQTVFGGTSPFGNQQAQQVTFGGVPLFGSEPATTGFGVFGSSSAANNPIPEDSVIALPDDGEEGEDEESPEQPTALITRTPLTLTYTVPRKSSIPSDGQEHLVTIAVLSFETDIKHVSVPRVDPRVYLQCQLKNDSEYKLLPGPVSIIFDESYVSKTSIKEVNRNDVFSFTLKDDPSVKIIYSRSCKDTKAGGRTFAEISNIDTYTVAVQIHNKHPFAIEKLIVKDAIPTSNDKEVKIILRKPEGLAEAKEGQEIDVENDVNDTDSEDRTGLKVKWEEEKGGLFQWRWRVDPDSKISLKTVYEIKIPDDLSYTFSDAKNSNSTGFKPNVPVFGQRQQ